MRIRGKFFQWSQVIIDLYRHGIGSLLYPDGRYMEGAWTQGVLTEVLNKVT
jgi:hypothetical protein